MPTQELMLIPGFPTPASPLRQFVKPSFLHLFQEFLLPIHALELDVTVDRLRPVFFLPSLCLPKLLNTLGFQLFDFFFQFLPAFFIGLSQEFSSFSSFQLQNLFNLQENLEVAVGTEA